MLKAYEFRIFTTFRILGIGIRPLIFYLCVVLPRPELGINFGLLVSAVASSFLVLANQNFRPLYEKFAGSAATRKGLWGRDAIFLYLDETVLHILLFTPLVAFLCWIWTYDPSLTVLCVLFCLLEKYFDEDQRIAIYQRRYFQWILNFSFRIILPSLILLGAMLVNFVYPIELYSISAILAFLAYLSWYRKDFVRVLILWARLRLRLGGWAPRVKAYWRVYRQDYGFAQAWVFATGTIALLDRFIISRDAQTYLAEYIFFANVTNLVPMMHGLFYFTKIRPQLIDRSLPAISVVFSWANLGLPAAMSLAVMTAVAAASTLGLIDLTLPYSTLWGIAALYLVAAISLVVAELAFWRIKRPILLAIELSSAVVVLLAWLALQPSTLNAPWLVALTQLGKLGLFLWILGPKAPGFFFLIDHAEQTAIKHRNTGGSS